jgi:hypothetical protein
MCTNPLDQPMMVENRSADQAQEPASTVTFRIQQAKELICPTCAAANEPDYIFCQQCGGKISQQPLPSEVMTVVEEKRPPQELLDQPPPASPYVDEYKTTPADKTVACPNCASEMPMGSAFCNMCGTRISVDHTVAMASIRPLPKARIRLIVEGEESSEEYDLGNETTIGRTKGDINFPFDDYMSSKHASIIRRGNTFILKDEGSRNGTLIRIDDEIELKPGDMFLIGKQIFRFEV